MKSRETLKDAAQWLNAALIHFDQIAEWQSGSYMFYNILPSSKSISRTCYILQSSKSKLIIAL